MERWVRGTKLRQQQMKQCLKCRRVQNTSERAHPQNTHAHEWIRGKIKCRVYELAKDARGGKKQISNQVTNLSNYSNANKLHIIICMYKIKYF
ncbi:hypothetical protein POVWA2_007290 [Plasmodium ovale wallikeri]|uniref:Uncharacterized protein n=1 Tax=Plasmodium ovale wallikeri TaxID=864142 RepID=A0A1A8YIR2_PLAOA|nr:hypothetical protein POVWA1_007080 [Plasmodium ovale wallikeri]SBT32020.1 hypothetical protein POVWA2_007290 [Plasmodium ovale wallikeri]